MKDILILSDALRKIGYTKESSIVRSLFLVSINKKAELTSGDLKNLQDFTAEPDANVGRVTDKPKVSSDGFDANDWKSVVESVDHPDIYEWTSVSGPAKAAMESLLGIQDTVDSTKDGLSDEEKKTVAEHAERFSATTGQAINKAASLQKDDHFKTAAQNARLSVRIPLKSELKEANASVLSSFRFAPIIGLIPTLYFVIKNLVEAANNGYKLLTQLPLNTYGIDLISILFGDYAKLSSAFDASIQKYGEIPVASSGAGSMKELAEIMGAISYFKADVAHSISNVVLLLIDIGADLVGLLGLFGGPAVVVTEATTSTIAQLAKIGIVVSAEMVYDYTSSSYWQKEKGKIRSTAEAHIEALS